MRAHPHVPPAACPCASAPPDQALKRVAPSGAAPATLAAGESGKCRTGRTGRTNRRRFPEDRRPLSRVESVFWQACFVPAKPGRIVGQLEVLPEVGHSQAEQLDVSPRIVTPDI